MRMSDWSSDVCSSDLEDRPQGGKAQRRAMARTAEGGEERRQQGGKGNGRAGRRTQPHRPGAVRPQKRDRRGGEDDHDRTDDEARRPRKETGSGRRKLDGSQRRAGGTIRSEEHTSELQSLISTTYAVICVKK